MRSAICCYSCRHGNTRKVRQAMAGGGEADFIDGTLQKPSGYRGYDTFGPFKLAGGIAKDRPDARDLEIAPTFFREMQSRLK